MIFQNCSRFYNLLKNYIKKDFTTFYSILNSCQSDLSLPNHWNCSHWSHQYPLSFQIWAAHYIKSFLDPFFFETLSFFDFYRALLLHYFLISIMVSFFLNSLSSSTIYVLVLFEGRSQTFSPLFTLIMPLGYYHFQIQEIAYFWRFSDTLNII